MHYGVNCWIQLWVARRPTRKLKPRSSDFSGISTLLIRCIEESNNAHRCFSDFCLALLEAIELLPLQAMPHRRQVSSQGSPQPVQRDLRLGLSTSSLSVRPWLLRASTSLKMSRPRKMKRNWSPWRTRRMRRTWSLSFKLRLRFWLQSFNPLRKMAKLIQESLTSWRRVLKVQRKLWWLWERLEAEFLRWSEIVVMGKLEEEKASQGIKPKASPMHPRRLVACVGIVATMDIGKVIHSARSLDKGSFDPTKARAMQARVPNKCWSRRQTTLNMLCRQLRMKSPFLKWSLYMTFWSRPRRSTLCQLRWTLPMMCRRASRSSWQVIRCW